MKQTEMFVKQIKEDKSLIEDAKFFEVDNIDGEVAAANKIWSTRGAICKSILPISYVFSTSD